MAEKLKLMVCRTIFLLKESKFEWKRQKRLAGDWQTFGLEVKRKSNQNIIKMFLLFCLYLFYAFRARKNP